MVNTWTDGATSALIPLRKARATECLFSRREVELWACDFQPDIIFQETITRISADIAVESKQTIDLDLVSFRLVGCDHLCAPGSRQTPETSRRFPPPPRNMETGQFSMVACGGNIDITILGVEPPSHCDPCSVYRVIVDPSTPHHPVWSLTSQGGHRAI